jgi:signal transduction histidine kinase
MARRRHARHRRGGCGVQANHLSRTPCRRRGYDSPALFKQSAEERIHVKINDLIQNALSLERIELQKRQVSLQLNLAPGLPDVLGDRVQLLQVILNLIRNAIEAMSTDRPSILGVMSQVDGPGDVQVSVADS